VIGVGLPANFLLSSAAELNVNSVNRAAIWIPDRAKDDGIRRELVGAWLLGLAVSVLRARGIRAAEEQESRVQAQEELR